MKKDLFSPSKLRVYAWVVLTLLIISNYSTQNVSGETYDFMTLQSNISAEVPSVILQNGTDNISFIYANNTSARVTVNATTNFETYNYTLEIVNNNTTSWDVKLEVYDSSNISRISNATIILHNNITSSTQIIISDGSITQSGGDYYNLSGSSTIYMEIKDLRESTEGTSYVNTYLRICTPDKTTYTLYIITFEFT